MRQPAQRRRAERDSDRGAPAGARARGRLSLVDDIRAANERYAESFSLGRLSAEPARKLAVLTCMDARLDVHKALGLQPGDAHVIRNAGGIATQDALRSLVVSSAMLGTEAAVVIGHTDCGMTRFSNPELRERLRREGIDAGDMDFLPFSYVDSQVVESVQRLRGSRLLPSGFAVHGFVYEVKTGRLRLLI